MTGCKGWYGSWWMVTQPIYFKDREVGRMVREVL